MRILFPFSKSKAGYLNSLKRAFQKNGFETRSVEEYFPSLKVSLYSKFNPFNQISNREDYKIQEYNKKVIDTVKSYRPDYFFNYSGGNLYPFTVKEIQEKYNCKTICFIGDNPFDPLPKRDKYFAMSLKYYNLLLLPEPAWKKQIVNIAPTSKIVVFYGGYEPENFFFSSNEEITLEEKAKYSCDIAFTGGSYGESAEGAYRASILGGLRNNNFKLWGDSGWKWRFKYYPNLETAYMGGRLSYSELRKLFKLSKIILNIPSPMLSIGFQPRVFEIAASKGFQIIDHTSELYNFYNENEIVTFKNMSDLNEKICYYLSNPEQRSIIIEKMYKKTINLYSWENQIKLIIKEIIS